MLSIIEVFMQLAYSAMVGELLYRRAAPAIYETDPIRCYRVLPNLDTIHRTNEFATRLRTDSHGFRMGEDGHEVSIEKPDDVYRILVTGPSFAFGWGSEYEEIYATLIGERLEVPGKRIEILNIGTPSQGAAQQLCWIERVAARYTPDMLLHTAYGSSVPMRPSECPSQPICAIVKDAYLISPHATLAKRAKAFFKNSGIVFYSYYAYNMIFDPEPSPDASKSLHSEIAQLATDDAEMLAQTYVEYEAAVRRALGDDLPIAFVFLPYSYEVHPEDVGRFSDVRASDVPIARARIMAEAEAIETRGLNFINTLPPLIEAATRGRLYFWLDIHFTPLGNQVVAEVTAPVLQALIDASLTAGQPAAEPQSSIRDGESPRRGM